MESGLNSDTEQVEVLPEDIVAAPVFVDTTGKRHRRFRTVGFLAGGVGIAYAAMLGLSFAGGPIAPNALLPIPGVPTAAPLAVADKEPKGDDMSAVSSDEEISRGDDGNRGRRDDRIDSTSTTTPRVTPSGTAKVPVNPTPTKPGPTPTKPSPTPTKPSPTPTKPSPTPTKPSPTPTKPADPPPTTKPADPPPTTKPADPPPTTKPADPPTSKPADPAPGTGAGGGGGSTAPKPPADPPADPPASNDPAPVTKAPTASANPSSTTES
ncbi:hypothetical protein [Cryptosporangium japonicum]|uniref:Uncharacterized protein n=1 Tax=Cryptosporangium japonicum TaxID=80872 RepID=A0ABP3E8U5_9ACTN